MNGEELINAARQLAEDRQTPNQVSNRLIWALGVDAFHERKDMKERLSTLEKAALRRAAVWGGLAGLLSAIATVFAVLQVVL